MKTRESIMGIRAYVPGKPIEETAKEIGMRVEEIIKLASNENPLGASPLAVEAMQAAAKGVSLYPDGGAVALREQLAEFHGFAPENIVPGAGSSELIELLAHICLESDGELIAAKYSFTLYPLMTQLFGAKYVEVENKTDYTHDTAAMLRAITPDTRILFITNPTNPLGTMIGQEELDAFMQAVPEHVLVVFDEAYIHFAEKRPDTLQYVRAGRNVAILRTFSKAYGLAGARIGYAITTPTIAELLHKVRSPFNTSSLAQAAAAAALRDEEHLRRSVRVVRDGMQQYETAFREMGLEYIPSHGNFVLVKIGDGTAAYRYCLQRGVILRPMTGYGLNEWIRISFGTRDQNERCIQLLREVCSR